MHLISKFNKRFRFSLCIIDIFKKGVSIVNALQKILHKSERKPNKTWVDKGSEFYNSFFKKWLQDNDIEMYSIHNDRISVIAERFIGTLKTKIYKYMTYMTYMTSKYKNVLAKGYTPNWSKEVFVVSKIKNTVPWTYFINDLNGEEIMGTFYEKELQKTNQEEFRIEKIIRKL